MKRSCVAAFLVLAAGAAHAQPLRCDLFGSDGTPAPVSAHFVLDQQNRRAVARNGDVFALEVEERRYRLSRRGADGETFVFVIDRDTGIGAWDVLPNKGAGTLLCYLTQPRL